MFWYRLEVRIQVPAVGIHPLLIPRRFHRQSRISSFRQKTESDKNTKTHSLTIVQTSDTSRVLLEMLPVSNKDMRLWDVIRAVLTLKISFYTAVIVNVYWTANTTAPAGVKRGISKQH
jgi:hypothetical protein